jgi:nucleoside-diphosphate-sugar epimerase
MYLKKIFQDIEIVIHCAYENPELIPGEKNYDEESLIQQAVQGTREIFNACKDTSVKRLVVTMCNDMTLSLIELDIVKSNKANL